MKALPRPPVKQRQINHIKELCLNFVAPTTPHPIYHHHYHPPAPTSAPPSPPQSSLPPPSLPSPLLSPLGALHSLPDISHTADCRREDASGSTHHLPFPLHCQCHGFRGYGGGGRGQGGQKGGRAGGQKGAGGRGADINFFLHSINTRKSLFCIISCLDDVSESIWVSIWAASDSRDHVNGAPASSALAKEQKQKEEESTDFESVW